MDNKIINMYEMIIPHNEGFIFWEEGGMLWGYE